MTGGRRNFVWIMLFGVLLALPSLAMGFWIDDYAQLALMEEWHPRNAGTFDMYAFLDELPLDPWWKHPEFKTSMWRPLPSALIQLDHRLFGHAAAGYHLHSILWFAGLLAACGALYARLLPARIGALALLVFAVDECHLLNVGWIANRHAMVAMLPALLGLLCHLRWRQDGWRPGLPLSVLGYAIGLLGGEVALSIMSYAFAYELLAGRTQRIAGLAPVSLVGGVYVVGYKLAGFGAARSGFYLDPTGDPAAFLLGAAGHLPAFLAAGLAGLPSDLWFFVPTMRPVQIITGCIASLIFAWLLRAVWPDLEERERHAARWLGLGALFSLLPAAITQPFDRVLIAPMIGGAALIAIVLGAAWSQWRAGNSRRWGRRTAAALAAALVTMHVLVPVVGRLAGQYFIARQGQIVSRMASEIPAEPASTQGSDVILLTAPDIIIAGVLPLIRGFQGKTPFKSWTPLSLAPHELELSRTGSDTLELHVHSGQMLASPPERFHRSAKYRLVRGDVVTTDLFRVEVLEDNSLGPTRLEFRFDRDLGDPDLTFLKWGDGGLERLALPPIGQSTTLPQAPGVNAVTWDRIIR